ncbi:MAG: hypothetical protein LBV67_03165 [Streptococcaceae bacterium]|jgi:hypothetical protein|nr:hypothetical protein [Streptococcaceae bacterium]
MIYLFIAIAIFISHYVSGKLLAKYKPSFAVLLISVLGSLVIIAVVSVLIQTLIPIMGATIFAGVLLQSAFFNRRRNAFLGMSNN